STTLFRSASVFELVVVWAWHAPALHALARSSTVMLVIEQASFFGAGLLVWMAAFGGTPRQQRERAVAGISGLLLASMHMTLLGVLLALAERPLYVHAHAPLAELTPLQDQQAGGVIMLLVGGAAYLAGALYRVSGLLKGHGHAVSARCTPASATPACPPRNGRRLVDRSEERRVGA